VRVHRLIAVHHDLGLDEVGAAADADVGDGDENAGLVVIVGDVMKTEVLRMARKIRRVIQVGDFVLERTDGSAEGRYEYGTAEGKGCLVKD